MIISDMNRKCANQKVFQLTDYICWIITLFRKGLPMQVDGVTCKWKNYEDGSVADYTVVIPKEQIHGFISLNQVDSNNQKGNLTLKKSRKSKTKVMTEFNILCDSLNRLGIKSMNEENGITVWCYFLRSIQDDGNSYKFTVNSEYVDNMYPAETTKLYGVAHMNDLLCMRTLSSYKLFKLLVLYSLPLTANQKLTFKIETLKELLGWDGNRNSDCVQSITDAISDINSSCDLNSYFKGKLSCRYNKSEKKIKFSIVSDTYSMTNLIDLFKDKNKEYLGTSINIPNPIIRSYIISYMDKYNKSIKDMYSMMDTLFKNYINFGYKEKYDTPYFTPKFFVWDGFVDAILEGKPCKSSHKEQEKNSGWRVGDIPNDLSEDMIKMMASDGFGPDQFDEWAKYNSKDGVVEEEF